MKAWPRRPPRHRVVTPRPQPHASAGWWEGEHCEGSAGTLALLELSETDGRQGANGEASEDAEPVGEKHGGAESQDRTVKAGPKDGRLDWGFEEGAPREAAGTGAGAAGREGAGQEHEGRLEKADGGRSRAALHGVR